MQAGRFQAVKLEVSVTADLSRDDGFFVESLISSIAQGDEAAKQRVRAFLEGRAAKVQKS